MGSYSSLMAPDALRDERVSDREYLRLRRDIVPLMVPWYIGNDRAAILSGGRGSELSGIVAHPRRAGRVARSRSGRCYRTGLDRVRVPEPRGRNARTMYHELGGRAYLDWSEARVTTRKRIEKPSSLPTERIDRNAAERRQAGIIRMADMD
jgi:hypothetical protein